MTNSTLYKGYNLMLGGGEVLAELMNSLLCIFFVIAWLTAMGLSGYGDIPVTL